MWFFTRHRERHENAELQEAFERWLDELTSDGAPWQETPLEAEERAESPQ
jgi:hypothetical protein